MSQEGYKVAYIQALIFYIAMTCWTLFLALLCLPLCFLLPPKKLNNVSYPWAKGCIFFLKLFCGVKHQILGKEYIPKKPSIIACKHQSAWETMAFHIILKGCSFVLKKELQYIPLYGFYLSRIGMVIIDRKGQASALKKMINDIKKCLDDGRSVIIFPEGTRTTVGKKGEYKSGVAALYSSKQLKEYPIVPVALNSGLFWPKNTFSKKAGTVSVEFMKPIERGMDKQEFMKQLEDIIDTQSDKLCNL